MAHVLQAKFAKATSPRDFTMIAKTAIVELLGSTPLFGSLDEADRRAVADRRLAQVVGQDRFQLGIERRVGRDDGCALEQ